MPANCRSPSWPTPIAQWEEKKSSPPPPTKQLLLEKGLEDQVHLFQPQKLSEISRELNTLGADLFIVAAYAKIIPQSVLDLVPRGVFGVHPSLLPNYRGPSPLQAALLDGVKRTGVTIYQMDKEVDHGPILASRAIDLVHRSPSYVELEEELAAAGAALLLEELPLYLQGRKELQAQDHEQATFTKKFSTEDGFVSPDEYQAASTGKNGVLAHKIERMVRALNPEPGVWTMIPQKDGTKKRFKLLEATIEQDRLIVKRGQWEGGRPLDFS